MPRSSPTPPSTSSDLSVSHVQKHAHTHIYRLSLSLRAAQTQPQRMEEDEASSSSCSVCSGVGCCLCDWAAPALVKLRPELWPLVSQEVITHLFDVAMKTLRPFPGKSCTLAIWPTWCDSHVWKGIRQGSYLSFVRFMAEKILGYINSLNKSGSCRSAAIFNVKNTWRNVSSLCGLSFKLFVPFLFILQNYPAHTGQNEIVFFFSCLVFSHNW